MISSSWVIAQKFSEKDSLDRMIGQMIMIGIGDFSVPNPEKEIFTELKAGKAGGVVLYEKNISSQQPQKKLASLIAELQKGVEIPLFISIDEEGGWVSRLKPKYGFPKNVSAQYLGTLDSLDVTSFYAHQTAALLDRFGINMNYAPVLDVNMNTQNPVIGKIERSFSSDYKKVTAHASEVIAAHIDQKVVPVVKHFPGHGSSKSDTHLGLADVSDTWQFEEIYPYISLIDSGKVPAIMTAHIVNRTLDESKVPATLSKKVISDLLRGFLHYDGVIISDDMQMGAIDNEYGLKEAIRLSINAGVDILMFANNVSKSNRVTASTIHSIIKEMVLKGEVSKNRIENSYHRIMHLKSDMGFLEKNYSKDLAKKLKTVSLKED